MQNRIFFGVFCVFKVVFFHWKSKISLDFNENKEEHDVDKEIKRITYSIGCVCVSNQVSNCWGAYFENMYVDCGEMRIFNWKAQLY